VGASGANGKDRPVEDTAFVGTRFKTSTIYTEAFGEDESYLEVNRPIPKPKPKSETRPKRKAAERFIRADYSYEPYVEESGSSRQVSRQHKKQSSVLRTDLADLLDKLSVDVLETALTRCDVSASGVDRFGMLVESIESHLHTAKEILYTTNEERWASFNTPYGETDPSVIDFLTNFVQDELSLEQQSICVKTLVRRMLQNASSQYNASKGFGLMLCAQVLFRENSWALIECLDEVKCVLPKVSNVHQVPGNYATVVQFIGAQLLANGDDDAPYAALSYALEILGYSGLHSKDSMALEFIARAFKRYTEAYGASVDPAYTRLSSAVTERALLELSRITAEQPPNKNKDPALARFLSHKIAEPLKELILYMGLLSADHHSALLLFRKVGLHSPDLCARVLPRLAHDNIQQYDDACRRTIAQLARDLAPIVEGRHATKDQPPMNPATKSAAAEFIESFHIEIHEAKDAHKANNGQSKRAKHESDLVNTDRRRMRTSFCGRLFKLLVYAALIWASVYYWNHIMSEENKHFIRLLAEPACKATHQFIAFVKPHYDTLLAAVNPHYASLCAAAKPHMDAACAAVRPHYEALVDAVKPHLVAFYDAVLHHSLQALAVCHTILSDVYDRLCELRVVLVRLLQQAQSVAEPHIRTILSHGHAHLSVVGKQLDVLPSYLASKYTTYVAPHVAELKTLLTPYTEPICATISPYWNVFLNYLTKVGEVMDKYGSFEE